MTNTHKATLNPPSENKQKTTYSVEFFHIYTDEEIGLVHTQSLAYYSAAKEAWSVDTPTVVLIDDYNPTKSTLTPDDVFDYLDEKGCKPDYWAYESDLVKNAETLLINLTNAHLERNYRSYINKHGKYPCSLLTATWYLTRLGIFNADGVIKKCAATDDYRGAGYLINILPEVYKPIEKRALELIDSSNFKLHSNYIQALFYECESDRVLELF